jgi:hypothetical protein
MKMASSRIGIVHYYKMRLIIKTMRKLLITIPILLLSITTSAIALDVENPLEPARRFTEKQREGVSLTGGSCLSVAKPNADHHCDEVVITGLKDPDSLLNFHFLDANGDGYVYVTERTKLDNRYKLLGWARENKGKFGKVHPRGHSASGCSIDHWGYKAFCSAISADEKSSTTSGMFQ